VTLGFAYLLIFLGGFTLALVTGFARRLLHPSELCDHVLVPSHEHLRGLRFPAADVLASFLTLFGLTCLVVHGLFALDPFREVVIGSVAGLIGIVALRSWLRTVCNPTEQLQRQRAEVRVVREIPASGYGQVEVLLEGAPLKLAARSQDRQPIPAGSLVEILDRTESVVVVTRLAAAP
jgi:membrane protein implicated in regulation of membrane protease activity